MRRYPRHRYPRHRYPVRRYAYRRARRSWVRALGLVLVGICLACGAWALLEGVIWPEEGDRVSSDGSLTMDYSHASQGYVLARASSSKRLKLRVSKGDTTLTYDLNGEGEYEVFPLQLGDGKYSWTLYENVTGNSYAQAGGMSFSVELEDANAPFLCPNQYVNFTPESQVVAVAAELCQGLETGAEKLAAVRAYIQENYLYDYIKAVTTTPGQMPDIEGCMESRMGICQDLAAMAAAMLRSQGVPVEFVVGYAGNVYHAWAVVLLEEGNVLYDPTVDVNGIAAGAVYTTERFY